MKPTSACPNVNRRWIGRLSVADDAGNHTSLIENPDVVPPSAQVLSDLTTSRTSKKQAGVPASGRGGGRWIAVDSIARGWTAAPGPAGPRVAAVAPGSPRPSARRACQGGGRRFLACRRSRLVSAGAGTRVKHALPFDTGKPVLGGRRERAMRRKARDGRAERAA